jgi:hypothetical protein
MIRHMQPRSLYFEKIMIKRSGSLVIIATRQNQRMDRPCCTRKVCILLLFKSFSFMRAIFKNHGFDYFSFVILNKFNLNVSNL